MVTIADDFTVATGLVTDAVARLAVEYDGTSMDLDLVDTRSPGLRAWSSPILAEYVDEAVAAGSGQPITLAGDTILRLTLTNMNLPTASTLDQVDPGTRYDGVGDIAEVYVGTDSGFERRTSINYDRVAALGAAG